MPTRVFHGIDCHTKSFDKYYGESNGLRYPLVGFLRPSESKVHVSQRRTTTGTLMRDIIPTVAQEDMSGYYLVYKRECCSMEQ